MKDGMKILERLFEKRIRALVEVDDMQFGFMPGRETTDAHFIVRRMQDKLREKDRKSYMGFKDLEKAFNGVPRRVIQWALRKKGLPKILIKAVVSLYEGPKMKVKVGFEFSKEFYVAVSVHQGSVLSPLLLAIVVDVVTKNSREGLMKGVLYTDDLVLISETMEGLKKKVSKMEKCIGEQGTESGS